MFLLSLELGHRHLGFEVLFYIIKLTASDNIGISFLCYASSLEGLHFIGSIMSIKKFAELVELKEALPRQEPLP